MKEKPCFISQYDFIRQKYPTLENDYGVNLKDQEENIINRLMAGEDPVAIFRKLLKPNGSLIERVKQNEELQRQKLEDSGQKRGIGSRTIRKPKTTSYKINPRDSVITSINYHGRMT